MGLSYATDISPKFRANDIACMRGFGVPLADAGWMCSAAAAYGFPDHGNARHVFDYLKSRRMPPGAPWPDDWIAAYQEWMDAGFNA